MGRLLLRLRGLDERERFLRRRALVHDRADRADHPDGIRRLPDVPAHVDAPRAFLDRLVRELQGVEFRLELRAACDDERHGARLDDLGEFIAVIRLDEMCAEFRGDAAGEAEVPRVAFLELLAHGRHREDGDPRLLPFVHELSEVHEGFVLVRRSDEDRHRDRRGIQSHRLFIEVVIFSFDRSSLRTLAPPLTRSTIGTFAPGSIEVRTTPRVTMTASAYGRSGSRVLRGISIFRVGPRKYPWSAASMTVRPSVGRMIRAKRFWSPHGIALYSEPVGIDAAYLSFLGA